MDLQGKIIAALEPRSGVSARGEWKSQDFVIETMDSFPRKMVFSVFGADRLQRFAIQVGQMVNVSFDIDAHEYNGRWFNNIRAFDVRPVQPATAAPGVPGATDQMPPFAEPAPAQTIKASITSSAAPAAQPAPFDDPFTNPQQSADPDSDLPF